MIENKIDVMDLVEVEVLLLVHEIRLEKFKKQSIFYVSSLKMNHTLDSSSTWRESIPPQSNVLGENMKTTMSKKGEG